MKTMICLVLDRSGSMAARQGDVVGGVNTFIAEQKKLPDPATIALVRFDSNLGTPHIERFRPMGALADCAPVTPTEYEPRGYTPLLDAIGKTINDMEEDWKREKPERAILVIVTDGEENDSREFKKSQIKQMIEARQASGLWAIIYIGANVDAFKEAGGLGISMSNTAGYTASARGTGKAFSTVSATAMSMRSSGVTMATNLARDLGEEDDSPTVIGPTATMPAPPMLDPTLGMPTPGAWTAPVGGASPPASGAWRPPTA